MKSRIQKTVLFTGALLLISMLAISFASINTNESSTVKSLNTSENVYQIALSDFDGEGLLEGVDSKCGSGKCGEGKCGSGSSSEEATPKKETKKESKKEKKKTKKAKKSKEPATKTV